MAERAIGNRSKDTLKRMRRELSEAVGGVIESMDMTPPGMSDKLLHRIAALADFTTRGRTAVDRDDRSTRDILFVPEIEGPARFAHQLVNITAGLLVVGMPEKDALQRAERLAVDSIPSSRVPLLKYFAEHDELEMKRLPTVMNLPRTTARRIAEDLEALGFITSEPGGAWNEVYTGENTRGWTLADVGADHLKAIGWR
jgi:hypothetical protein